jgi:hypothetical protein
MSDMNMKWFQNGLRLIIAAGSVTGFLGGWVLLAHAGKPVEAAPAPAQAAPAPAQLPELAPLEPVPQLQPLPTIVPSQPGASLSTQPRLRTRSSR